MNKKNIIFIMIITLIILLTIFNFKINSWKEIFSKNCQDTYKSEDLCPCNVPEEAFYSNYKNISFNLNQT